MQRIKRLLSIVLTLGMLLSLAPLAFAEGSQQDEVQMNTVLADDAELSGQLYKELFGEGGDYEIIYVELDEDNRQFVIDYIALTDTTISFSVIDEDSRQVIETASVRAPAGQGTVTVAAQSERYPTYYRAEANLKAGGDPYVYSDHTRAYQQFLSASPEDSIFEGRVIVDYGMGYDQTQNFAVVREDVKVIYVDSMDEVEQLTAADAAELFGDTAEEDGQAYLLSSELGQETTSNLQSGDKVLILPRDNANNLKALVVRDVVETGALFSEDGDGEQGQLAVISEEAEPNVQEFYDYIRVHAEVEADTDDLDTSTADDDVEVLDDGQGEGEDDAELLGYLNASKYSSKTFNLGRKTFNGITVEDNFTIAVSTQLTVEWSGIWLSSAKATASASVSATNNFRIYANYSVSTSREWSVGTINLGTAYGISFSIPVSITFYASFGAGFSYNATQRAYAEVTARYSGGKASVSTYKSASADRSITSYANATVRIGVKPGIRAKLVGFDVDATLTAEVGLEVSGSYRNGRFSGTLSVYIQPGFRFHFFWWTPVNTTWGRYTSVIATFSFARAVYDTMDDLAKLSLEEINANIAAYEDEGYAVTISSPEELRLFAEYINSGKPTRGIDFAVSTLVTSFDMREVAWTPAGTAEHPFQGTFDGRGITLTGLKVNGGAENAGLFGCVDGAIIHDIVLDDAEISGSAAAGILAGHVANNSRIYDVGATGTVSGTGLVGGLAGELKDSSLLNSYVEAELSGGTFAGGVAGSVAYKETAGQIANCYFVGSVTDAQAEGGIAGEVKKGESAEEELFDAATRYTVPGVTLCYYSEEGLPAVGEANGCSIGATALESAQIAEGGSLLQSLNDWYRVYGAVRMADESIPENVPDASVSDFYSKWTQDAETAPRFAPRGRSYKLTVTYVYEDGTPINLEGFEPTVLYLELGEKFDVDPKPLEGYYTNVDEGGYTGWMNPDPTVEHYAWNTEHDEEFDGLLFQIIYVKNESYSGSLTELTADTPAAQGDRYAVATREDLEALAAYVNAGGSTRGVSFIQTAAIPDASGIASIGTEDHPFAGSYSGNSLEIQSLNAPLFGTVDGAELTTLNLTGTLDQGTSLGLVAVSAKNTTLRNTTVDVSFSGTPFAAGGLFGSAEQCTVDVCTVNGTVRARSVAGGIAAEATACTVMNCAVNADVSSEDTGGGLVGAATRSELVNSYVSAPVDSGRVFGGLAGVMIGGCAENCYALGALFGTVMGQTVTRSLFYMGEAVTASGDVSGCESFTEDDTAELAEKLNAWVEAKTTARYMTWGLSASEDDLDLLEADGYPVLGQAYESWLMEFHVADGELSFQLDRAALGDGEVLLAVYDASGRMLSMQSVVEDGSVSIAVDDSANRAAIFVVDDVLGPMMGAIHSAE